MYLRIGSRNSWKLKEGSELLVLQRSSIWKCCTCEKKIFKKSIKKSNWGSKALTNLGAVKASKCAPSNALLVVPQRFEVARFPASAPRTTGTTGTTGDRCLQRSNMPSCLPRLACAFPKSRAWWPQDGDEIWCFMMFPWRLNEPFWGGLANRFRFRLMGETSFYMHHTVNHIENHFPSSFPFLAFSMTSSKASAISQPLGTLFHCVTFGSVRLLWLYRSSVALKNLWKKRVSS